MTKVCTFISLSLSLFFLPLTLSLSLSPLPWLLFLFYSPSLCLSPLLHLTLSSFFPLFLPVFCFLSLPPSPPLSCLSPQVALLFSLWVETVRPYLEIVDEWIVHGHLFDPAKEFIIQRYGMTSAGYDLMRLRERQYHSRSIPLSHAVKCPSLKR